VVESVVQPVLRPAPEVVPVVEMPPEDEPEVRVLVQSEDPKRVAPNITPGATGVAASFEGGLDAGQGPPREPSGRWSSTGAPRVLIAMSRRRRKSGRRSTKSVPKSKPPSNAPFNSIRRRISKSAV